MRDLGPGTASAATSSARSGSLVKDGWRRSSRPPGPTGERWAIAVIVCTPGSRRKLSSNPGWRPRQERPSCPSLSASRVRRGCARWCEGTVESPAASPGSSPRRAGSRFSASVSASVSVSVSVSASDSASVSVSVSVSVSASDSASASVSVSASDSVSVSVSVSASDSASDSVSVSVSVSASPEPRPDDQGLVGGHDHWVLPPLDAGRRRVRLRGCVRRRPRRGTRGFARALGNRRPCGKLRR